MPDRPQKPALVKADQLVVGSGVLNKLSLHDENGTLPLCMYVEGFSKHIQEVCLIS